MDWKEGIIRRKIKLADLMNTKLLLHRLLLFENDGVSESHKMKPLLFNEKVNKYYYHVTIPKDALTFTIRLNRKTIEEYKKIQELRKIELQGSELLSKLVIPQPIETKSEIKSGREKIETIFEKQKELGDIKERLIKELKDKYGEEVVRYAEKLAEKITFATGKTRPEEVKKYLEEQKVVLKKESYIEELEKRPISYNLYEFRNLLKEIVKKEVPTVTVHIRYDKENSEIRYIIEDAMALNKHEQKIFEKLLNAIEETPGYITTLSDILHSEYKNKQEFAEKYVYKWVRELIDVLNIKDLNTRSLTKIVVNLLRHLVGYKDLNPLFYDKENIEDISYVEIKKPIRVRYRLFSEWIPVYIQRGNKVQPLTFNTIAEANEFVRILAQKSEQYVNVAMPIVNGRLPDNSRLHAKYSTTITSPEKGPTFTIRLKRERTILPLDLILWRTVSPEIMAYAWMTIEIIPTASIVIAGTTGAGKTTTLQSILMFIPPTAKILSIEDTPELKLPHPHWEATYTLESSYSKNKITMFDLVKGALRERPDYIVVQEVRGSEAMDMFHAMASGHAALTTFHAGSFEEVVNRFINEPINVPKQFLASTLKQVWIQLIVPSDVPGMKMARKVVEIWEVGGMDENGNIIGYKLFEYDFIGKRFVATPQLVERMVQVGSIFYTLMIQMGFETPDELIEEFTTRSNFLRMLSTLYKVYIDKTTFNRSKLGKEENIVYDEIMSFWEKYERRSGKDLSKMFFNILFDYRTNKEDILEEVVRLYDKALEVFPDLREVVI